jgi:hypothetical protein
MLFHRALLNMALNSSLDRDIKLIDIRVDWHYNLYVQLWIFVNDSCQWMYDKCIFPEFINF